MDAPRQDDTLTIERAEWVICCDDIGSIHKDAAVVTDLATGGILWVGEYDSMPEDFPKTDTENKDTALMPGFVNGHAHTAMSIMRGTGDGIPLDRWLKDIIWPIERTMTPEDAYWSAAVGAVEMLCGGITSSAEMYAFDRPTITALRDAGMRVSMASTVFGRSGPHGWSPMERLEHIAELADSYRAEDMVHIDIGLHAVYSLGLPLCQKAAGFAAETNMGIHIHLSETDEAKNNVTEYEQLKKAGVFDVPVLGAHGIYLTKDDMDSLGAPDSALRGVVHCPVSNARMGARTADVAGMMFSGMTVGLGTDGPVSGGPLDMFEAMRTALALARILNSDPGCLRAADVLYMATAASADAAGLRTGRLEKGMPCDMARVDLSGIHMLPQKDSQSAVIEAIVLRSRTTDVVDVWVKGVKHVENSRHTAGWDNPEGPVAEQAREQAEALLSRAGLR